MMVTRKQHPQSPHPIPGLTCSQIQAPACLLGAQGSRQSRASLLPCPSPAGVQDPLWALSPPANLSRVESPEGLRVWEVLAEGEDPT